MGRTCDKWGSSKENKSYNETATNNEKEPADILGKHEKRKLEDFNTHRAHQS